MSTLKTGALRGTSGTADSIQLHASDQSVTFPGNVTCSGTATGFARTGRVILEQFYSPCDGSVIATSGGNITLPNVTALQDTSSDSYITATGSEISYTPPTGATQVIYEYNACWSGVDSSPLAHCKFYIDSDEVTSARTNMYDGDGDYDMGVRLFKWGINIGGTASTANGRLASWTSSKTLKLNFRRYNSTLDVRLHSNRYWDGDLGPQFSKPCIGITAIG